MAIDWKLIEEHPKKDDTECLLYNELWDMSHGAYQIGWWNGEDGWEVNGEMYLAPDDEDAQPTHYALLEPPQDV